MMKKNADDVRVYGFESIKNNIKTFFFCWLKILF